MRIKLDENLPESLLASLSSQSHDVDNVRMEGLTGRPDPDVWQSAQTSQRYLITQDMDFSNMKKFTARDAPRAAFASAAPAGTNRSGPAECWMFSNRKT